MISIRSKIAYTYRRYPKSVDHIWQRNFTSQKTREMAGAFLSSGSISSSLHGPKIETYSINLPRKFSNKVMISNSRTQAFDNSQLQVDRELVDQLLAQTEIECNRKIGFLDNSERTISPSLDLIGQWYEITNSIHIPKTYRKRNRFTATSTSKASSTLQLSDDAIATLQEVKIICAKSMDRLLQYHIQNYILEPSKPKEKSFFGLMIKSKGKEPNTRPFALVMEAWNQSSAPESGQRSAEVLESWGKTYGGDMENAPTRQDFDVVLETFAKCSSGDYSSFKEHSFPAEMAWDLFSVLSRQANPSLLPAIATCSHLVNALSNHAFVTRYAKKSFETKMDSEIAAIRAYFAWKRMMEIVGKQKSLEDGELVFIWRAHADILNLSSDSMLRRDDQDDNEEKVDESDLALKVGHDTEELLVRLLRMHGMDVGKNDGVAEYLCQAFSSTMVAWTKEQDTRIQNVKDAKRFGKEDNQLDGVLHGAKSVAMLLDIMKEQGLVARPEHYHSAIQAYANCLREDVLSFDDDNKLKEVLPRVRKLLKDLEIDYLDKMVNRQCDGLSVTTREKVDASIYRTVLDCFSQNLKLGGHKNDSMEAAKILERMLDLYERDLLWIQKGQKPLTVSLNRVFKMIYRSKPTRQDVVMASELLERLSSLPMKGREDSKSYIPRPDATSYSSYITILSRSKSKDAASRVVSILDEMESDKIRLRAVHYAAAIKCLVQGRDGEHKLMARELLFKAIREYNDLSAEQQLVSDFNAAILYASMITPTKSSEAISLLTTLEKQHEHTMDERLKPDLTLYSAVLHAIAIDRNRAPWKDEKALQIYGSIDNMYRNGDSDMMPNKYCCTAVLEVLSKSKFEDATEIAQGILEDMDELYLRTGRDDVKPDFRVFLALMKIWASSNRNSKAKEAWSLCKEIENRFQKVGDNSLKPSVSALNVVLNACAYTMKTDEQKEALEIVEEIQKTLCESNMYGTPDTVFYNNIIKSFGFLLKERSQKKQREKGISVAFERCCTEGLLSEQILQSLKRFYPELYMRLPGFSNGNIAFGDLPTEWSRNAGTKFRPSAGSSRKTTSSSSTATATHFR